VPALGERRGLRRVAEYEQQAGQLAAQHGGDGVELLADVLGVGFGEDGADRGGDHLRGPNDERASLFLRRIS
jgi:hypothetical protein